MVTHLHSAVSLVLGTLLCLIFLRDSRTNIQSRNGHGERVNRAKNFDRYDFLSFRFCRCRVLGQFLILCIYFNTLPLRVSYTLRLLAAAITRFFLTKCCQALRSVEKWGFGSFSCWEWARDWERPFDLWTISELSRLAGNIGGFHGK